MGLPGIGTGIVPVLSVVAPFFLGRCAPSRCGRYLEPRTLLSTISHCFHHARLKIVAQLFCLRCKGFELRKVSPGSDAFGIFPGTERDKTLRLFQVLQQSAGHRPGLVFCRPLSKTLPCRNKSSLISGSNRPEADRIHLF